MTRRILQAWARLLPALVLCTPTLAQPFPEHSATAASTEEMEELRAEVRLLQEQIKALQLQIQILTGSATGAGTGAAPAPPIAGPEPPAPQVAPAAPAKSPSLLNPAISAVFQAIGNTSLRRQDDSNGFDLSEAEVAFQSVVDPYAKMDLFLTFPVGETPEVEEGFVTTLALPAALQLKGGRYKNAFGKWNTLHAHAFFTVEKPIALTNFFGEESLTTDGLSLGFLIPNPWDLYLESTSEVGTAREGVSFNSSRRALTTLERFSAFFTTSPDSTLELGVSGAWGKTGPSEALEEAIADAELSGTLEPEEKLRSRAYGIDATYKWKPLQLNTYRSLLWQTELLLSRRDSQQLNPALVLENQSVSSLGGYSYFEWQFAKRWLGGVRADFSGFPESETARETGAAAVLRFRPSEFQELRFQIRQSYRNDDAATLLDGSEDDTRIFFEWIPAIGAHGAHKY